MAESDRERWDRIWRESRELEELVPPDWIAELDAELPRRGRALEVACGTGGMALYWAGRGLDTLAVDISGVALDRARASAQHEGLRIATRRLDLEREPLPGGPFALISVFHYLQRDLFPALAARLAPGGVLVCEIATVENLERNPKPSRRFLLERGELPGLCAPLEVVHYREGWDPDRCLARLLARGTS
jgi:SAM-dependent methyltransferase